MIILNIIRIIYSHYIVKKYGEDIDIRVIDMVKENHSTSLLTERGLMLWVNYLCLMDLCPNWSKEQMFREALYHKKMYRLGLFKKHTDYVDFEEHQTFVTYLRRFIGNCIL